MEIFFKAPHKISKFKVKRWLQRESSCWWKSNWLSERASGESSTECRAKTRRNGYHRWKDKRHGRHRQQELQRRDEEYMGDKYSSKNNR